MKRKTLKLIIIALMTIANICFIGYMEDKSKSTPKQEWKSKIKVPRHG